MISARRFIRASVLAIAVALASVVNAQDVEQSLFSDADRALEEARKANAELLAPTLYSSAMKSYRGAEDKFERGRSTDTIRRDLDEAIADFERATEAAAFAAAKLARVLKARAEAKDTGGTQYAPEFWAQGEDRLRRAAVALEDGDLELAQQRATEAGRSYREAELIAIKANYLETTRRLLAQAEEAKVEKYAPKTLQRSRELLAEAEQALTESRYEIDVPRSLARQAEYEARHAIYLATIIQSIDDEEMTTEDLILEWEKPLRSIADTARVLAAFDGGYDETTGAIVAYIEDRQAHIRELEQDLTERDQQIAALNEDLERMTVQRRQLAAMLKEQEKSRTQIRQVEKMFVRNEALVLREGNDIMVRLVGLDFDVGKAAIKEENAELLTKLEDAIALFPNCTLVIEGHTDSQGDDRMNYDLSRDRANAVREYLLNNAQIDAAHVSAVGYGETRPVATNDTESGRANNRRIDVLIRPPT